MNSPGNNYIPRLFYGTEDIMVLQTNTYNRTEFENIVEILDYWRKLYKDPELGIDERNMLLDQIRETYLENEALYNTLIMILICQLMMKIVNHHHLKKH